MDITPENYFTYGQRIAISKAKMGLQALIDRYDIFNNLVLVTNPNKYLEENCIFAGGYFASQILDSPLNDIDLFILNNNDTQFKTLVCLENDRRPGRPLSQTVFDMPHFEDDDWIYNNNIINGNYLNNITVQRTAFNKHTKVQYILSSHKTRQELLNDFDMVHCTVSYVHGSQKKLYITKRTYDTIASRKIIPNTWPIYTSSPQSRLDKLIQRGWSIDEDAVQKVREAYNKTRNDDINRNRINQSAAPISMSERTLNLTFDNLIGDINQALSTPWDMQTK